MTVSFFLHDIEEDDVLKLREACPHIEKLDKEAETILANRSNQLFGDDSFGRWLASLKTVAESNGRIRCHWQQSKSGCASCGKRPDPVLFKSGPRKGWTKQSGEHRVFGLSSLNSVCTTCFDKERFEEAAKTFKAEVQHGPHSYTYYRKDDERECFDCGAKMWESEMGRRPALMEGDYPAKCPECGAEQILLGKTHKSTGGWRLIEVAK